MASGEATPTDTSAGVRDLTDAHDAADARVTADARDVCRETSAGPLTRQVSGGRQKRAGGLHRPEPVAVAWDERRRRPSAFVWRGRRYRVARVMEFWIVETGWWNDETRVSRSYSRVEADGRLFDLCYDRLTKAWSLDKVLN